LPGQAADPCPHQSLDFTEDLKKIDVPMPILQGDADRIVSIDDASRLSAKLVGA
jgi:hypothetical protein